MTTGRGLLVIVSAPSGCGKDTVIEAARDRLAAQGTASHHSISHTTREPRPAEVAGRDYHFVDRPTFERMVAEGAFLEWAEYAGNLYGTSRQEVEGRLAAGQDVFLDIDVQGARQLKARLPDAVSVFLLPPSFAALEERLERRRQDPPEAIRRRLQWGGREIAAAAEFDYAMINDRLDVAVDALLGICLAERHRTSRQRPLLDRVRDEFQHALDRERTP